MSPFKRIKSTQEHFSKTIGIIFTASLSKDLINAYKYADDTGILFSFSDPMNVPYERQIHLTKISLWLNKWSIKINAEKSIIILR